MKNIDNNKNELNFYFMRGFEFLALMGNAQWAQKCKQTDIEISLAIIYQIKFLITFITFIK